MSKYVRALLMVVCLLIVPAFLMMAANTVSASDDVTLTGTVNESGQFLTDDGTSCFIEQNEEGAKLALLIGKKAEVTGTVKGEGDQKTITITSFKEIN